MTQPPRLPLPPIDLRRTVGPVEDSAYDNPAGVLVYPRAADAYYERVFDFGCGCGRVARQMMLQTRARPRTYVGIDLNKDAVAWCRDNLTPHDRNYQFLHHDVFNAGLNPRGSKSHVELPVRGEFTFVNAHSVFTHIVEPDLKFAFGQCVDRLAADGIFRATWFLFDRAYFPMMQDFQHSLYVNLDDPTQAAIYDYKFILDLYAAFGLTMTIIVPPVIRGFQWEIYASKDPAAVAAAFPEDAAPIGLMRPPTKRFD